MDRIPGVKAFLSVVAVRLMGPEAHHRQHTVMLLDPERGDCKKNNNSDQAVRRNIGINWHKQYLNVDSL